MQQTWRRESATRDLAVQTIVAAPETSAAGEITWELSRKEGRIGTGNWKAFPKEMLPELVAAASEWKETLRGIERPWLCWCVDADWCYAQQRLVRQVGWTPVVGTDGHVSRPRLAAGSVFVDFNRRLKLPLMWMFFPQDFVHLMCDRLAFWHSDVLVPASVLRRVAEQFNRLTDGELVCNPIKVGILQRLRRLRKRTPLFYRNYGNFLGCITAGASRSFYENGCGWWRNPQFHPNAKPQVIAARPHWEHGVGVWLWEKYFGGKVTDLCIDVTPYHYSAYHPSYVRRKDEKRNLQDSKQIELARSFDVSAIVAGLGLPKGE